MSVLKLLIIVILAWLILRTARNLLVAATGGAAPRRDRMRMHDSRGTGENRPSNHERRDAAQRPLREDIQDAVWKDLS